MRRNTVIPEVHLVLRRQDQLLMLRRLNTGYEDGKYSLIAGHAEQGETFTQAIIREAQEEAGLNLTSHMVSVVHTMHRKSDSERLSLFFSAHSWTGEPINNEPDKCDDLRWFPINQRPPNTIAYINAALDAIAAGKAYSEFGW